MEERLSRMESSNTHGYSECSNCQIPACSCLLSQWCGTPLIHKSPVIHRFLQGCITKTISKLTDLRNGFVFYYIGVQLKRGIFSIFLTVAFLWLIDGHLSFHFWSYFLSLLLLYPFHLTHYLVLTHSHTSHSILSKPWTNWSNGLLVTFYWSRTSPKPLSALVLGFCSPWASSPSISFHCKLQLSAMLSTLPLLLLRLWLLVLKPLGWNHCLVQTLFQQSNWPQPSTSKRDRHLWEKEDELHSIFKKLSSSHARFLLKNKD